MRRYLTVLVALSLLAAGTVAAFTRVMDPFGAYGRPVTNRPAKVEAITRSECTVVALGSSRTELGVDPRWDIWESIGPACNTGLGAMEGIELAAGIDYVVEETAVETLVVMIDFFMFDDARNPPPVAADTRFMKRNPILYHLNSMLSRRFVEGAWEQWELDRQGRQKLLSINGYPVGLTIGRGLPADERFSRTLSAGFLAYLRVEPSEAKLDLFADALEEAIGDGRAVEIVIHPMHALHLELIDAAGLWDSFEDWKRSVATSVRDLNARLGSAVQVWDFARYSGPALERVIEGGGVASWQDSSHYTASVGRDLMAIVLEIPIPEERLWPDAVDLARVDVEAHLASERAARDQYRSGNPDQIVFLDGVLASVEDETEDVDDEAS